MTVNSENRNLAPSSSNLKVAVVVTIYLLLLTTLVIALLPKTNPKSVSPPMTLPSIKKLKRLCKPEEALSARMGMTSVLDRGSKYLIFPDGTAIASCSVPRTPKDPTGQRVIFKVPNEIHSSLISPFSQSDFFGIPKIGKQGHLDGGERHLYLLAKNRFHCVFNANVSHPGLKAIHTIFETQILNREKQEPAIEFESFLKLFEARFLGLDKTSRQAHILGQWFHLDARMSYEKGLKSQRYLSILKALPMYQSPY
jgi:hypothetical protein